MCALAIALACAAKGGNRLKYPQRPAGCKLALYHGPTPEGLLVDDLGVVDVGCYIDDGEATCLNQLKSEACRLGADVLYDVPPKALRPHDRGLEFRGRAAHTKPKQEKEPTKDAGDFPPPATPEESAAPVIPLTGPGSPTNTSPSDGGLD